MAPAAEIGQILRAIRRHLGIDVAFVFDAVGEERVFRLVDGAAMQALVPEAPAPPATAGDPAGAQLSVPLVFSDGSVYGTFRCSGHAAGPSLDERDLGVMRAMAEVTAAQIEKTELPRLRKAEKTRRIRDAIEAGGPAVLYQPIILLGDRRVVGVEALARFAQEPLRTPDRWFAEAGEVGLQVELELAAIRNAIEGWAPVWQDLPLQLGINCSPAVVVDGRLRDLFAGIPADRVVLELTEHDQVDDYFVLNEALHPLRALGVKVAIDDTGSGYASMRHILTTRPNIIKLDISLTRNIDADPMRRSLAEALIGFAAGFGGRVVAEGVETEAELDSLHAIGVQAAQGYYIARPMTVSAFRRFLFQR